MLLGCRQDKQANGEDLHGDECARNSRKKASGPRQDLVRAYVRPLHRCRSGVP